MACSFAGIDPTFGYLCNTLVSVALQNGKGARKKRTNLAQSDPSSVGRRNRPIGERKRHLNSLGTFSRIGAHPKRNRIHKAAIHRHSSLSLSEQLRRLLGSRAEGTNFGNKRVYAIALAHPGPRGLRGASFATLLLRPCPRFAQSRIPQIERRENPCQLSNSRE